MVLDFFRLFLMNIKINKIPQDYRKRTTLGHTFLRKLTMRSFPGKANLEKNHWFLVSSSSSCWLGCLISRTQNALLSTANNALMFATGTVENNLCMVKFWRYIQETGVLKYHTLYANKFCCHQRS